MRRPDKVVIFTSTLYNTVTTNTSMAEFLHPKIKPTESSRGASYGQNIRIKPFRPIKY